MMEVGDRMPAFELEDQSGQLVRSEGLLARGPLILYFYPKDETPGCIAEACGFRDSFETFTRAGATVVGVSSDSVASHAAFAGRYQLPFSLLSDKGGKLRKAMGVPRTLGILDGRVTFVVDGTGTIRHTFKSQIQPLRHVKETLRIVQDLLGT